MTKLIIEYSDDIDEIKVDERFEITQQIAKSAKFTSYKLYVTDKKVMYVSVYPSCSDVAIQNRVSLKISENDDIIKVATDFSKEVRIKSKIISDVMFKIFLS